MTWRKPRDTKWDAGLPTGRSIGKEDEQAMAEFFRWGLKIGKSRDDLLYELSEAYGKSMGQIERYIGKNKDIKPLLDNVPDSAIDQRRLDHWDDLARKASSLWLALSLGLGNPETRNIAGVLHGDKVITIADVLKHPEYDALQAALYYLGQGGYANGGGLYAYLMEHLRHEDGEWLQKLTNLGTTLNQLVGQELQERQETGLRRAVEPIMKLLEVVKQRKTFKGGCLVCP